MNGGSKEKLPASKLADIIEYTKKIHFNSETNPIVVETITYI
jgi:hypothetical protein